MKNTLFATVAPISFTDLDETLDELREVACVAAWQHDVETLQTGMIQLNRFVSSVFGLQALGSITAEDADEIYREVLAIYPQVIEYLAAPCEGVEQDEESEAA